MMGQLVGFARSRREMVGEVAADGTNGGDKAVRAMPLGNLLRQPIDNALPFRMGNAGVNAGIGQYLRIALRHGDEDHHPRAAGCRVQVLGQELLHRAPVRTQLTHLARNQRQSQRPPGQKRDEHRENDELKAVNPLYGPPGQIDQRQRHNEGCECRPQHRGVEIAAALGCNDRDDLAQIEREEAVRAAKQTEAGAGFSVGQLATSAAFVQAQGMLSFDQTVRGTLIRGVLANPQARHFFFYLIILLAAILGQDVLLEPYGGEAFGLSVEATTRITSIWGGCVLVALLAAGFLERRIGKKQVARWGAWGAIAGFVLIAGSGLIAQKEVFYSGVLLLGLGTGLSTVSNLSLMLDMTTAQVGLFIGAWGVADALARLVGTLLAGVLRDVISAVSGLHLAGYIGVFVIQAGLLAISLVMLRRIAIGRFRQETQMSLAERTALMNDA